MPNLESKIPNVLKNTKNKNTKFYKCVLSIFETCFDFLMPHYLTWLQYSQNDKKVDKGPFIDNVP